MLHSPVVEYSIDEAHVDMTDLLFLLGTVEETANHI